MMNVTLTEKFVDKTDQDITFNELDLKVAKSEIAVLAPDKIATIAYLGMKEECNGLNHIYYFLVNNKLKSDYFQGENDLFDIVALLKGNVDLNQTDNGDWLNDFLTKKAAYYVTEYHQDWLN